jgi:hypothetical protein
LILPKGEEPEAQKFPPKFYQNNAKSTCLSLKDFQYVIELVCALANPEGMIKE